MKACLCCNVRKSGILLEHAYHGGGKVWQGGGRFVQGFLTLYFTFRNQSTKRSHTQVM